jgi:hypothetical protein
MRDQQKVDCTSASPDEAEALMPTGTLTLGARNTSCWLLFSDGQGTVYPLAASASALRNPACPYTRPSPRPPAHKLWHLARFLTSTRCLFEAQLGAFTCHGTRLCDAKCAQPIEDDQALDTQGTSQLTSKAKAALEPHALPITSSIEWPTLCPHHASAWSALQDILAVTPTQTVTTRASHTAAVVAATAALVAKQLGRTADAQPSKALHIHTPNNAQT